MHKWLIYLLALGAFLTGVAELAVVGLLPALAHSLNISVALAGQLITAYSLSFAIGSPILAVLTAQVERRKLLILALLAFLIGCVASILSTTFLLLMASRVLLGLSAGMYLVIVLGTAAKLVEPDRIGRAMGTIALAFSLASVLGGPLGIALSRWWSWHAIFVLLGIGSLLAMAGIGKWMPTTAGEAPTPLKQQLSAAANPIIASGLLMSLLFTIGVSVMNTYLVPFLQQVLNLPAGALGGLMLLFGVCGVIGSRAGGMGIDRWGTMRLLFFSLILIILTLLALPWLAGQLVSGAVIISIWMFAISMAIPAMQTYFVQQVPDTSSFALGLNTSALHLGVAIGAGAGGVLASRAETVLYHPWVAGGATLLGLAAAAGCVRLGASLLPVGAKGTERS